MEEAVKTVNKAHRDSLERKGKLAFSYPLIVSVGVGRNGELSAAMVKRAVREGLGNYKVDMTGTDPNGELSLWRFLRAANEVACKAKETCSGGLTLHFPGLGWNRALNESVNDPDTRDVVETLGRLSKKPSDCLVAFQGPILQLFESSLTHTTRTRAGI